MRRGGYLLRKVPAGIAVAPFEFMFLCAYGLASGNLLMDELRHHHDVTLHVLPFRGWVLTTWLAVLLAGCVMGAFGILSSARWPRVGMRLERGGLIAAGCMIVVYMAGIISMFGFSVNISLVTIFLELLAFVYKIVLIGHALDALENPGEKPR